MRVLLSLLSVVSITNAINRCSDLGLNELFWDNDGKDWTEGIGASTNSRAYVGCYSPVCTALYACDGSCSRYDYVWFSEIRVDGEVRAAADTTGYSDVTVLYDMNPNSLEGVESCNIEYSTDGGSSWTNIQSYTGNTDFKNEQKVLAGTSNTPGFEIRFTITTDSTNYDYCNIQYVSICASVEGTCAAQGLALSKPHACQCQSDCGTPNEDRFCRDLVDFVAPRLKETVDDSSLCVASDDTCCCSCPGCDGYVAL